MSTGNVERIINKYADLIRPDQPNLPNKIIRICFAERGQQISIRMKWSWN